MIRPLGASIRYKNRFEFDPGWEQVMSTCHIVFSIVQLDGINQGSVAFGYGRLSAIRPPK